MIDLLSAVAMLLASSCLFFASWVENLDASDVMDYHLVYPYLNTTESHSVLHWNAKPVGYTYMFGLISCLVSGLTVWLMGYGSRDSRYHYQALAHQPCLRWTVRITSMLACILAVAGLACILVFMPDALNDQNIAHYTIPLRWICSPQPYVECTYGAAGTIVDITIPAEGEAANRFHESLIYVLPVSFVFSVASGLVFCGIEYCSPER